MDDIGGAERIHPYDLVEPMQYLFVKIVKARRLAPNECPYVKIRTSSHYLKSKPTIYRPGEPPDSPEWREVFALGYNKQESANATLEISVWDSPTEHFLGGVCFDLSDVPVRESPVSPPAPQWYRLEGGAIDQNSGGVSGDIQLAVWIGAQNNDAFPEARSSDAPYMAYTRSREGHGDLHEQRCDNEAKGEMISKETFHVASFPKEMIRKWEQEDGPLEMAMKFLKKNKGVVLSVVIAFSIGVLVC